jgi:hypothetical protein
MTLLRWTNAIVIILMLVTVKQFRPHFREVTQILGSVVTTFQVHRLC